VTTNALFWVVIPCGSYKNRRIAFIIRLPRIGLMMKAIWSSETSVLTRTTQRKNPEDGIRESDSLKIFSWNHLVNSEHSRPAWVAWREGHVAAHYVTSLKVTGSNPDEVIEYL
jgi:hypothetical protein